MTAYLLRLMLAAVFAAAGATTVYLTLLLLGLESEKAEFAAAGWYSAAFGIWANRATSQAGERTHPVRHVEC